MFYISNKYLYTPAWTIYYLWYFDQHNLHTKGDSCQCEASVSATPPLTSVLLHKTVNLCCEPDSEPLHSPRL